MSTTEIDDEMGEQFDAETGEARQKPFEEARHKIVFERITAAELDSGDYTIEYLIEGAMTAGQPMIVAGGKKQLKTNMLLDAGISLATGGMFLGQLKVTRSTRVAIMSGESGMATIQETCRRICKAKELELRNIDGLIFSSDLPRLDDIRYLDALGTFIERDEIEVIIFDPAYLMMPGGDAGNLFIQGEMLRSLSQRCEQLGVTMVLCHHTKKGIQDPYSPPELEHIAWAGFQEFARQWWLIGRREPYESGTGNHALWLNIVVLRAILHCGALMFRRAFIADQGRDIGTLSCVRRNKLVRALCRRSRTKSRPTRICGELLRRQHAKTTS